MAITSAPEGTILVGTDGSDQAQRAVVWAAREATMRRSRLTILTAWSEAHLLDATMWAVGYAGSRLLGTVRAGRLAAAAQIVDEVAAMVRRQYPDLEVRTVAEEGDACATLMEYGKNASLIVVGSHGAGNLTSATLGSVAFWLTRHAAVPLAVVPTCPTHSREPSLHRGVVAGISLDPQSQKIVEVAAQEAEGRGCDLILAHCAPGRSAATPGWKSADESCLDSIAVEIVERLAATTDANYPQLKIRRRFACGAPARFLADLSTLHEVLVIGRRSSKLLDLVGAGTMGPTVFHDASCVVLAVPLTREDDEALESADVIVPRAHVG